MNKEKILFYIHILLFILNFFITFYYYKSEQTIYERYSISNFIFNSTNHKSLINIQYFINQKIPITPFYFRHFLEENATNLYLNYRSLVPCPNRTLYHTLLPFHSNGIPKKLLDYHDLLKIENVNIKHFTSFLNHGDKHENETRPFLIKSQNGPTLIDKTQNLIFTLIYGIGIGRPTPFLIREIKAFSHKEVAIIIFYDNKSNRTLLYNLFSKEAKNEQFKNVYFIDSPRFHVGWGQIIQAFPQFIVTQAALKFFPKSLYVSFHSESDYPIVPNDCIMNYLKRQYPNNYLSTIYGRTWKHKRKNQFYLFFTSHGSYPNNITSNSIIKMMRYLFPVKYIPSARWMNGWNWYTMTLKDSKLMIQQLFKRFDLIDTLEHVLSADEIIFSTLAAEAKINSTNNYHRFIFWRGGEHPVVYTESYFSLIANRTCDFWARKFAYGKSNRVLDMIDSYIGRYDRKKFESNCYK